MHHFASAHPLLRAPVDSNGYCLSCLSKLLKICFLCNHRGTSGWRGERGWWACDKQTTIRPTYDECCLRVHLAPVSALMLQPQVAASQTSEYSLMYITLSVCHIAHLHALTCVYKELQGPMFVHKQFKDCRSFLATCCTVQLCAVVFVALDYCFRRICIALSDMHSSETEICATK